MFSKTITTLILIVGLINFIPITGAFSADQLAKLYGVNSSDNNLLILLKHRALLFGLIGGFIIYAAFTPSLHKLAFIFGFISMLGFVIIAWNTGGYNELLKRFFTIDLIALLLLIIALVLKIIQNNN